MRCTVNKTSICTPGLFGRLPCLLYPSFNKVTHKAPYCQMSRTTKWIFCCCSVAAKLLLPISSNALFTSFFFTQSPAIGRQRCYMHNELQGSLYCVWHHTNKIAHSTREWPSRLRFCQGPRSSLSPHSPAPLKPLFQSTVR